MPRLISATYHTKIKVAEFIADDGRHLLRTGGTLPWRINNCGDLSSPVNSSGEPNPKLTRNFIGFASVPNKAGTHTYHFFIFPDYETGRTQLEASLKRKYGGQCIPELVKKYAPDGDNDSQVYAESLLKATGIADDKKVGELSNEEFNSLADAIEKLEGYHNEADTRKEIWVPVSTILASDGSRPLADEEIVLRMNGKDMPLKSNAVGQFPPIPHPREPVQVLQRTPDDKLKEIGPIGGDKGQSYSLLVELQRFLGMSGPDKPPSDTTKHRQPFTYQVQPGDTMAAIAKRFRTSVDQIKEDNRRFNDKLFAGELLSIYSPSSQDIKPTKVARPSVPVKRPQKTSTTSVAPPPPAPITATPTLPARSDDGEGKPLALLPADQRRAPWMAFAIAEAKRLKGMTEADIEAGGTNYHTAIKDGIKSMIGNNNAWCAAFVNWCLLQAGYPIDTKGGWAARARGIYSHDSRDEQNRLIQNPLFSQIQKPIYGCIALVVIAKSSQGKHVGFVYAQEDDKTLVVLGGNQSDRICFDAIPIEARGKKLLYFVPASYQQQASTDEKLTLESKKATETNKALGISMENSKTGATL